MRALSAVLGEPLPYNSLGELRTALFEQYPHLAKLDEIHPGDARDIDAMAGKTGKLNAAALKSPIVDFYLTNPIARASKVMAQCSAQALGQDSDIMEAAE